MTMQIFTAYHNGFHNLIQPSVNAIWSTLTHNALPRMGNLMARPNAANVNETLEQYN